MITSFQFRTTVVTVTLAATLTTGVAVGALATATPSLDRLVYASTRDGNTDLWAADVDGTDQRRLTTNPAQDVFPDVSPNGRLIVFMRGVNVFSTPFQGHLWVMNADGTGERRLLAAPVAAEYRPDFSRDGQRILFTRHAGDLGLAAQDLWVIDVDGTDLRRVVANATYGSWSPDGRRLVYAADRGDGFEIWVSSTDGTDARPLTSSEGSNVAPQWSPDGSRIVFTSTRAGKGEVWVMDADGEEEHLVVTSDGRDGFATWSPDSRYIAFASTRDTPCPPQLSELCPHQIYTVSADGTDVRRVAENAVYDIHPAYFPRARRAAGTGAWDPQASMLMPRYLHEGGLLRDGRVIMVAGNQGAVVVVGAATLPVAEIFDRATGAWTATAPMVSYHAKHTVTVLNDGRVLVAGGEGKLSNVRGNDLTVSEVYDPATDEWTATGAMAIPLAHNHSATLLPNGQVLVAGGQTAPPPGNVLSAAQLYDPLTNTWSATGEMHQARSYHASALLADGRVLVAGGLNPDDDNWPPLAAAEVWDPNSGGWTEAASMNIGRHSETEFGAALPDGRVLVAGGASDVDGDGVLDLEGGVDTATAEVYDPATNAWSLVGSMADARSDHTVTSLADGRVLALGGIRAGNVLDAVPNTTSYASGEVFDSATGLWTPIPAMSVGRANHAAVVMADGSVLAAGGHYGISDGALLIHASAERWDAAATS